MLTKLTLSPKENQLKQLGPRVKIRNNGLQAKTTPELERELGFKNHRIIILVKTTT